MTVESDKVCPICSNASEYAWRMTQVEKGTTENNRKMDRLMWLIITNLIGVLGIFLQVSLNT